MYAEYVEKDGVKEIYRRKKRKRYIEGKIERDV